MMPFAKCPVCGGELEDKEVEKLLHGGNQTAVLRVRAGSLLALWRARLYSEDTVRYFEQIRARLNREDLSGLQPLGRSFALVSKPPGKASVADA